MATPRTEHHRTPGRSASTWCPSDEANVAATLCRPVTARRSVPARPRSVASNLTAVHETATRGADIQRLARVTVDHHRTDPLPGALVIELDLAWLLKEPLIAEGGHRGEHIPQRPTHLGDDKLVARRVGLAPTPFDHAFGLETVKARGEKAPVDLQLFLELIEPASAQQEFRGPPRASTTRQAGRRCERWRTVLR